MKPFLTCLFLACTVTASAAPDWITETAHEFITTGRFQTPSDGTDLLVVDKATGLARLGLKNGASLTWTELPTGMSAITGLTTLRSGTVDAIATSSAAWNAVQLVSPGGSPQTLSSPVVGPHALVRLSTGHVAGAVVEDVITLGSLGDAPDPHQLAALAVSGATLFNTPVLDLPVGAQFIPLSPATGLPVLVSTRGGTLRVDRMDRSGIIAGGFDVTGPHPAGVHWTAVPGELFSIAKTSLTLTQHRIVSSAGAPGFTLPTSVAQTTTFTMPEQAVGLDAVPFTDPAYPALRCLVAIRFASAPNEVHLYRLLDAPTPSAEELMTLTMPPGEDFAGLTTAGDDFQLLSGPGGRVKTWQRYAQPGPGQLPVVVASGTLPPLRTRAASPNIFIFNADPFTASSAVLIASQSRLNWTTLTSLVSQGETDGGTASGLGGAQNITLTGPPGFALGNQLLAGACLAGFGPVAAVPRPSLLFSPPAGAYAALEVGASFKVSLSTASPTASIHYRLPGSTAWSTYSAASPPALTASGSLTAYSIEPATGARSPLVSAAYTFAALPPVTPAAAVDANLNGLSDAWERAFGINNPNTDDDGDGFNAITEQNYGTDPLDAGSHPAGGSAPEAEIAAATVQAGEITLAWPDGLVGYILESSPDLLNWTPVNPQPIDNTWSEPITGPREFYRLRKL
jgi:hypothetical protein